MTAVVSAVGCSDSGVLYGPPGGLSGKSLPQPTHSAGGGASSEAGAPSEGGVVGDGGPADGAGLPQSEASSCSVSWSRQIFANMAAAGRWKCGDSSCHGGVQSPKVTSDPATTYSSFVAFIMTPPAPALPFVLPGSADPSRSGIECNLSSAACGPEMPLTQVGAQPLTKADVAMLDTWVKCGAPNN